MKLPILTLALATIAGHSGSAVAAGELQPNSKQLCGVMSLANVEHEVCVTIDVVRYGNGTSHKAYFIKQYQGGSATTVTPSDLSGVKITGCQFNGGGKTGFKIKYAATGNAQINGTTGVAGQAPRVTCDAKKGNGSQPAANLDTFTMY